MGPQLKSIRRNRSRGSSSEHEPDFDNVDLAQVYGDDGTVILSRPYGIFFPFTVTSESQVIFSFFI
jgi:hypothetical protein